MGDVININVARKVREENRYIETHKTIFLCDEEKTYFSSFLKSIRMRLRWYHNDAYLFMLNLQIILSENLDTDVYAEISFEYIQKSLKRCSEETHEGIWRILKEGEIFVKKGREE